MQSEVAWGIALILAGIVLIIVPLYFFGVPLIIVGIALILFRGREAVIEKVAEEKS